MRHRAVAGMDATGRALLDWQRHHDGMDPRTAAGLRGVRRPRQGSGPRGLVGIYQAQEAGMEADASAGTWATVCELHATLVLHTSRALANGHAGVPDQWCGECAEAAG